LFVLNKLRVINCNVHLFRVETAVVGGILALSRGLGFPHFVHAGDAFGRHFWKIAFVHLNTVRQGMQKVCVYSSSEARKNGWCGMGPNDPSDNAKTRLAIKKTEKSFFAALRMTAKNLRQSQNQQRSKLGGAIANTLSGNPRRGPATWVGGFD
jgi:hypothetical protein